VNGILDGLMPMAARNTVEAAERGKSVGTGAIRDVAGLAGINLSPSTTNSAEDLARNLAYDRRSGQMTDDEQAKVQNQKQLVADLRKNPSSADDLLGRQVDAGKITAREAGLIAKHAGMSDLQWSFRQLNPDDALKVWNAATDNEKQSLRDQFTDKIKRAQIGPDAQNKLFDSAGIERPFDLGFNQELSTLRGEQRAAKNAGRTFEGGDFSRLRQLEGFDRFIQQNNRLAKTGTIDQAEADRRNRQLVAQATKRAA
jgi:hypothetical protein